MNLSPYFLEDKTGNAVTVNGVCKQKLLNETNHFNLNDMKLQHLDIHWPLRSPDLTPLDFFVGLFERKGLWRQTKAKSDAHAIVEIVPAGQC